MYFVKIVLYILCFILTYCTTLAYYDSSVLLLMLIQEKNNNRLYNVDEIIQFLNKTNAN